MDSVNDEKIGKKEDETKQKGKSIWKRTISIFFPLSLSVSIFGVSLFFLKEIEQEKRIPASYFTKKVKDNIKLVIENGARLDVVKHIYLTREIKEKGIVIPFITKIEEHYPEPTSLSTILNDVKRDYYTSKIQDTVFLTRLQEIIDEHEEVNPFDKLASNQKFMFENVRQKLDTNYVQVREDLNRIADEMNNRNLLVDEYLEKSNLSYWLSIAAIIVTIVLSTIQIYQNRSKGKNSSNNSKTIGENPQSV